MIRPNFVVPFVVVVACVTSPFHPDLASSRAAANDAKSDAMVPSHRKAALAGDVVPQRVRISPTQVNPTHDTEFVCVGERAFALERAFVLESDNRIQLEHGPGVIEGRLQRLETLTTFTLPQAPVPAEPLSVRNAGIQPFTERDDAWSEAPRFLMARCGEADVTAEKGGSEKANPRTLISQPLAKNITEMSEAESQQGFVALFDGASFDGWEHGGNWKIEEGAFYRASKGGALTYKRKPVPDDFELRFEWKVSKGCNSGVYYRPGQVEYQVLDNVDSPYGENPRQAAASLFFCMAPSKDATRPVGQWNTGRVVCKGSVIQHWLNGEKVLDFDYSDPKWAAMVELLTIRGGDLSGRGGELWLQDHGQPVWYRNLRWRQIPADEQLTPSAEFQPMPVPPGPLAKEQARVQRMLEQAKAKAKGSGN